MCTRSSTKCWKPNKHSILVWFCAWKAMKQVSNMTERDFEDANIKWYILTQNNVNFVMISAHDAPMIHWQLILKRGLLKKNFPIEKFFRLPIVKTCWYWFQNLVNGLMCGLEYTIIINDWNIFDWSVFVCIVRACLSVCLSVYLSVCLSVCLSVSQSVSQCKCLYGSYLLIIADSVIPICGLSVLKIWLFKGLLMLWRNVLTKMFERQTFWIFVIISI